MGNLKVGAVKLSTTSFDDEKKKEKTTGNLASPINSIGSYLNGSLAAKPAGNVKESTESGFNA